MHRRHFLSLVTLGAPAVRTAFAAPAVEHLRVVGSRFVRAGKPFAWRGITSFRLAELLAHGRQQEAIAYLDWAAKARLTVLRVFVMADGLFQLSLDEGLRVLPDLLRHAASRSLYVELVVLTGTAVVKTDMGSAVRRASAIAVEHANALVEIANEPWHPTQDVRLHDPAFAAKLAALVPSPVPVALGSAEAHDGYAAGRYVTWHSPRTHAPDGWGHVLKVADVAALAARWKKPLVSDEPIGAADAVQPGRRDNDPRRFGAAAALTALAGLGATFHYEGGLQSRIPSGRELECFSAWRAGLDAFAAMPDGGRFLAQADLNSRAAVKGMRAVFGRAFERETWVLGIDPSAGAAAAPLGGAVVGRGRDLPGARLYRLTHRR